MRPHRLLIIEPRMAPTGTVEDLIRKIVSSPEILAHRFDRTSKVARVTKITNHHYHSPMTNLFCCGSTRKSKKELVIVIGDVVIDPAGIKASNSKITNHHSQITMHSAIHAAGAVTPSALRKGLKWPLASGTPGPTSGGNARNLVRPEFRFFPNLH